MFESCNIGADRDIGGREGMPSTMTCDKCEMDARWKTCDCDGGARVAPRLFENIKGMDVTLQ